MEFDRTQAQWIENKIEDVVTFPQLGEVVGVTEHTSANDKSNHEVDVILRDEEKERRNVPVMSPASGDAYVPQAGDAVVIIFLDGDGEAPVVVGNIYDIESRAPLGREGIKRRKRGSLYTEIHEDGDWARIAKKSSDDGTPTSKVEIDDSGNTTKLNIETDGDITISADGDVLIDEGGTAQPVAVQGHDHDFTYDGGGDNSSTLSGTTNTPNQNGTETEIE